MFAIFSMDSEGGREAGRLRAQRAVVLCAGCKAACLVHHSHQMV